MSFNNVTINDGSVARLKFVGHLVTGFDGAHILHILQSRIKAVVFYVLNPVVTTASGGRPVYGDGNLVIIIRTACTQQEDNGGDKQVNYAFWKIH